MRQISFCATLDVAHLHAVKRLVKFTGSSVLIFTTSLLSRYLKDFLYVLLSVH